MSIQASQYAHMDGLTSSPEVLAAIEDVAGVDFDAEDCTEDNVAYRIWSDPTEAEMTTVTAKAWDLADEDEDVLHWGIEKLVRKSEAA